MRCHLDVKTIFTYPDGESETTHLTAVEGIYSYINTHRLTFRGEEGLQRFRYLDDYVILENGTSILRLQKGVRTDNEYKTPYGTFHLQALLKRCYYRDDRLLVSYDLFNGDDLMVSVRIRIIIYKQEKLVS